jgi:hypothetical protein
LIVDQTKVPMISIAMQSIEMTGEKFNLDTYFSSRKLCHQITQNITSRVGPGISENEGQQLIKDEFKKEGITRFWHPSKFRIGPETVKSFRDLPDESIRLGKGDIFFLDVGPIIEDHEADYGNTFVLPSDGETEHARLTSLAETAYRVWRATAEKWRETGLSGVGLFEFADSSAKSFGFQLNPLMAGHRLGDFPHALFSRDKLFSMEIVPKEHLWVLEIHIVAPDLQRGAFFEDILS